MFVNQGVIAGPVGLGNKAGGAHFQETESPVQEAEYQCAQGHGTDVMNFRQMADHGGVHRPHQGRGNVGQDHRSSQGPYGTVGNRSGRLGNQLNGFSAGAGYNKR